MRAHRLAFALLLAAAPALAKGPPWISIEFPANPFDRDTRGAFLVVHTYHHETEVQLVMRGTAEGLVAGQRRSVPLDYTVTARSTFALTRTWGDAGAWVLNVEAFDGRQAFSAVVGVRDGEVSFVRVPVGRTGTPRTVTRPEIETLLAGLAAGRVPPQLAAR